MSKRIEKVADHFWDNIVNEDNRDFIESFLEQPHLSPDSVGQYRSALKIFAKWIYDNTYSENEGREKLITELIPRDAGKYQAWLKKKGLSSGSIRFKRSAVSSLCIYIEGMYDKEYPNFRNIFTKAVKQIKKSPKKEKNPLNSKELSHLADVLEEKGELQKLAYLWFTYITGCRREESRQIRVEIAGYDRYVNKKGDKKEYYQTHTVRAKGAGEEGKIRRFNFDQRAMDAITAWVEYRKTQVEDDDCEFLFVSKRGGKYQQVSKNTFNSWCQKFSEILEGRPVHPHLIRSTRATIAKVEDGVSIESIQKMLGHNSSETTKIYIVNEDDDDDDDLY